MRYSPRQACPLYLLPTLGSPPSPSLILPLPSLRPQLRWIHTAKHARTYAHLNAHTYTHVDSGKKQTNQLLCSGDVIVTPQCPPNRSALHQPYLRSPDEVGSGACDTQRGGAGVRSRSAHCIGAAAGCAIQCGWRSVAGCWTAASTSANCETAIPRGDRRTCKCTRAAGFRFVLIIISNLACAPQRKFVRLRIRLAHREHRELQRAMQVARHGYNRVIWFLRARTAMRWILNAQVC